MASPRRTLVGAAVAILMATAGCSALPASDNGPAASPLPTASAPPAGPDASSPPDPGDRAAGLAAGLRAIVAEQRFPEVVDIRGGTRIAQVPNVDVAVIELDRAGRPVAAANVLLDRFHPRGVAVPVDADLGTSAVRWRRWDAARWSAGLPGVVDLVKGRQGTGREFMAPYPASVFKLLVAFGILRLVDRGVLRLDTPYRYVAGHGCAGKSGGTTTKTHRQWLDGMLTYSDDQSACALIQQLHAFDAVDDLNTTLRDLDLGTLQLLGTDPRSGARWTPRITMTALDTARLLLIVSGPPGVLWQTPQGAVRADAVLTGKSRQVFLKLLTEQGLNLQLSTPNWCGQPYPQAGIPQRIASRWVDPDNGTVTVPEPGRAYGQDVRPCNARAEVTFAHKTGLTANAGSDAGIVTSLPGARPRRYIVVMLSNLGTRYGDPGTPSRQGRDRGVRCTEKFASLGRQIDALMTPGQ